MKFPIIKTPGTRLSNLGIKLRYLQAKMYLFEKNTEWFIATNISTIIKIR